MFSTKIQIRFSDCDMLNHVNNAIYLQYFETARIHFLTSELPEWDWNEQGIILANNNIDYLKPLFLTDECHITVFCTKIGQSSFTLGYHVFVKNSEEQILKSKGESVLVCFNFKTSQKMTIPENLLKILKKSKSTL
ncbi:MAG: acyl-CoA thioesterase [Crocinitomicaceae bacterium]